MPLFLNGITMKNMRVVAALSLFLGVGVARGQCMEWALAPEGAGELLTEIPGVVSVSTLNTPSSLAGTGLVNVALAWDPDGEGPLQEWLVVAGWFTHAGKHVATKNIAAWDGSRWVALGAGLDGQVESLALFQGRLIAGGRFNTSGGNAIGGLAEWTGSEWRAFAGGVRRSQGDTWVKSVSVDGNKVYVAGNFDRVGEVGSEVTVTAPAVWDGGWSNFETPFTGFDITTIRAWRTPNGESRVAIGDSALHVKQNDVWQPVVFEWPWVTWWDVSETGGLDMFHCVFTGSTLYMGYSRYWDGDFGPADPVHPAVEHRVDVTAYIARGDQWLMAYDIRFWSAPPDEVSFIQHNGAAVQRVSGKINQILRWRNQFVAVGAFGLIDSTHARSIAVLSSTGSQWRALGGGCSSRGSYAGYQISQSTGRELIWSFNGRLDSNDFTYTNTFKQYLNGTWSSLPAMTGVYGASLSIQVHEGEFYLGTFFLEQGNLFRLVNNQWVRFMLPAQGGTGIDGIDTQLASTSQSLIIRANDNVNGVNLLKYRRSSSSFVNISSATFGDIYRVAEVNDTLYSTPITQPYLGQYGLAIHTQVGGWVFEPGPFTSRVESLTSLGTSVYALEQNGKVWVRNGSEWAEITPRDMVSTHAPLIKTIGDSVYVIYRSAVAEGVVGRWRGSNWQEYVLPVGFLAADFHELEGGVAIRTMRENFMDTPGSTGFLFLRPSGDLCPSDFNCDGGVDNSDIEAFFRWYEAGSSIADVNQDGGTDGADVQYFFELWEGGC